MERLISFSNIECTNGSIGADIFCDGKYVVRMVDKVDHLVMNGATTIGLYECFKMAMLELMPNLDFNHKSKH